MFIDVHTHAFAEKIAAKAVEQLISYYQIPTDCNGSFPELLSKANQAQLDAMVLLVAATKPEQLKPANDWSLELAALSETEIRERYQLSRIPKLVVFGTFHPENPDWPQEIRRLRAAGIKGIKLHPEFQNIDLADPRLLPFYEEIERDLILMTHVGDPKVNPDNHSTPRKIAKILKNFPKLKVIAAHFGGLYFWDEVLESLAGKEVYFDTSSTLPFIRPGLLRAIVAKHGTDRLLFGSDYPLQTPQGELEIFDRKLAWLNSTQRERILGLNAQELLGI